MKKLSEDRSPSPWAFARAVLAIASIPSALFAQTSFQLGTVYPVSYTHLTLPTILRV